MSSEMPRKAVDPAPFDLAPDFSSSADVAGALCLHGLTGTPYEVRSLGEALAARGIRARGPLLPGHNSTPEALRRLPSGAWVSAVHEEYRRLREEHERVYVVGLSLGGLLSLELASHESVDGLVVVGTPLRFKLPLEILVAVMKHVTPMMEKREGSNIRDPEARSRHPGYQQMPLASVHELMRLQRVVRGRLTHVRAPALVAHGAHDTTARPVDAERIYGGLGSQVKRLEVLEDSAHVVPVDHDGPRLAAMVADFLASLPS
jgi:carboxylesterase